MADQRCPSGDRLVTSVRNMTRPCAVIAQTLNALEESSSNASPPMAASMNGSCVGSLWSGATAHQEFSALYRLYRTHLRRRTHEFHDFFA